MCRDRLPRPNRADFPRRAVTNCKHEIHFRRAGFREFVPALTAQISRGEPGLLQMLQRVRIDASDRMAPGTVRREVWRAPMSEDRLGHNGARGITSTEKQHIVSTRHDRPNDSSWGRSKKASPGVLPHGQKR